MTGAKLGANEAVVAAYTRGTYTWELAEALYPDTEPIDCQSAEGVLERVAAGQAAVGLVPFYNVYASTGGVPVAYGPFLGDRLHVHDVIPWPIVVACAANRDDTSIGMAGELKRVYLMGVLMPQCSIYIEELRRASPGLELVTDGITTTKAAFAEVKKFGRGAVALGRKAAALDEGLAVLRDEIQNYEDVTYFLKVAREEPAPSERDLLCVETVDAELTADRFITETSRTLGALGYRVFEIWPDTMTKEPFHLAIAEVHPLVVKVPGKRPDRLFTRMRLIGHVPVWHAPERADGEWKSRHEGQKPVRPSAVTPHLTSARPTS